MASAAPKQPEQTDDSSLTTALHSALRNARRRGPAPPGSDREFCRRLVADRDSPTELRALIARYGRVRGLPPRQMVMMMQAARDRLAAVVQVTPDVRRASQSRPRARPRGRRARGASRGSPDDGPSDCDEPPLGRLHTTSRAAA